MFGRGKRVQEVDDDQKWIEEAAAKIRSERQRDELRKLTTDLVVAMVASGRADPTDEAALRAAVAQAVKAAQVVNSEVRNLIQ